MACQGCNREKKVFRPSWSTIYLAQDGHFYSISRNSGPNRISEDISNNDDTNRERNKGST